MDDFDTFWSAYPLKVSKGDARKAWVQTSKIRPPVDKLIEAIGRYSAYKNSLEWLSYKHPASWLRAECWSDVYETPKVEASRPSITCIVCKAKAFTWTDGKCRGCWRTYMGMTG